jgi:hypothetical protein
MWILRIKLYEKISSLYFALFHCLFNNECESGSDTRSAAVLAKCWSALLLLLLVPRAPGIRLICNCKHRKCTIAAERLQ